MAVSCASASLLLLLAISSLDWLSPASAFLTDWDHMTSAPLGPHITECISRDQETFRCWWSPGTFQNLSSPGALRLFYIKSPMTKWKECPEYIDENRECFFDANHTSIWKPYCMQLRSQDNTTFFSEDDCFTVENIVRPDPPVSLNWTLLNVSPSGLSYDVMVSWEPPPSADVERGWMRIEYELQYRERNATNWEALEVQPNTQQTIYGLQIGKEFELHIRCRMKAFTKFGDFSESIFIQATEIPSQGPAVLLTLVLIFGIVGIFILILLIVLSQQQRLMMILLPPVPAPKIKGIDSEMLKKGKLEELNFILSGGGIGGLPPYSDAFYQDEPWVEFIEVDEEDADVREDSQGSDTERLLALPQSVSHRTVGSSNSISQPSDDSDQPSCYAADLHERDNQIWMGSLLPGQPEDGDPSLNAAEQAPASERGDRPLIQTQTGVPQTWVNTDFYAQVSNVMPSGGVVLSPGQQLRTQDGSTSEKESQKKGKQSDEGEENEDRKPREPQFQLLVVDAEGGGYTTESNARQIGTPLDAPMPGEGYQTIQPTQSKPAATTDASQSPYILPDSPPPQFLAPVADYTVVQELDTHHSLLLNPPPRQSPPPCLPQHPLKAPMPIEYVTPDLLGNFSP
ncbi:growth hormone receptor a isoform X2 [Cololabis saira]|nr:growth hormone receptor a isoform X2 [Cololabis saira]